MSSAPPRLLVVGATGSIGAVVFTHGSDANGKQACECVDYGGVRNTPNMPLAQEPERVREDLRAVFAAYAKSAAW